jgi:hypothetical protein
LATTRSSGRVKKRPITTTAAIAASTRSACMPLASPAPGRSAASSGTRPISGIAAMSWNSRIAKLVRPTGAVSRLRSFMLWIAIAVDESASASPATSAARHGRPTVTKKPASSAPHSASCMPPPRNTSRRISHSRLGSSSSPIANSISTTPNSAKCMIDSTSSMKPSPNGPIAQPATR